MGINGEPLYLGFQGVHGSFSEEALLKHFGHTHKTCNYEEFEDVFEALRQGTIEYGVLPIENSSTGSITQIYDLLRKYNYYIVGETKIKVEHHLFGIKGATIEDIKELYSHPQGFQQSTAYLKKLKGVQLIPYYNTAISAKHIQELGDKTKGAIASKRAGMLYELDLLQERINTIKENYTRFVVIGREKEYRLSHNKMTVLFTLPHKAGTLYDQLKIFSAYEISMSKIESRPVGDGTFHYCFYIDADINLSPEEMEKVLFEIQKNTVEFKLLGTYQRED